MKDLLLASSNKNRDFMMTIAYWCILAVILLPYVFGPIGQLPGLTYEQFKTPRARQPSLTGWHARANAAHMNGLEIVAGFAASVIVLHSFRNQRAI